MPYEQRLGSGVLFRNRDKGENDKAPDLKTPQNISIAVGNMIADLEIAAWKRHSDKAGDFYSISVKVKHVKPSGDANLDDQEF